MAFLAERMAAMVLETAIPDLAAAGIADALISDGKVVAPATDAVVSAAQRFRRRRRMVKNQNKTSQAAVPPKELLGRRTDADLLFAILVARLFDSTRLGTWGWLQP